MVEAMVVEVAINNACSKRQEKIIIKKKNHSFGACRTGRRLKCV
jgi:hypothetical protein